MICIYISHKQRFQREKYVFIGKKNMIDSFFSSANQYPWPLPRVRVFQGYVNHYPDPYPYLPYPWPLGVSKPLKIPNTHHPWKSDFLLRSTYLREISKAGLGHCSVSYFTCCWVVVLYLTQNTIDLALFLVWKWWIQCMNRRRAVVLDHNVFDKTKLVP